MSNLRNIILSKSNLTMLEDLSIKKIHNAGISVRKTEPFFIDNFRMVVVTILEEEEKKKNVLPVSKINGIIIKEVVNFIIRCANEPEDNHEENLQSSTKLDLEDDDDFFEELKRDNIEQIPDEHLIQDTKEVNEIKPIFKEHIYCFETNDTEKMVDGYKLPITMGNIKELRLHEFSIDNSDYIVTEYNNSFAIDNVDIILECGNYTAPEVEKIIQQQIVSKIDGSLEFKLKSNTDGFCFQNVGKKTKSLTGSLKEQKPYHIDFGTANSISKLLGFEAKSYKLKNDETIEGVKHRLGYNQYINLTIGCGEHEICYKILLDVGYNKTKYFMTDQGKSITSQDDVLFDVDNIRVKIKDMYDNFYNTRGRNFNISFRINQLKN